MIGRLFWCFSTFAVPMAGLRRPEITVAIPVHRWYHGLKVQQKIWECVKTVWSWGHNGSNYLNIHCFVSLMLCVPIWNRDRISYLAVPLGYRMWQKKELKLELASIMVRQVMPEFHAQKNVITLCDSWYVKQNLVSGVNALHSPVPIFIPVEHWSKLLRAEIILVVMPIHGMRQRGIEMLLNLINISHYSMKLLLYIEETLSQYRGGSAQEFRSALSE